MQSITVTSSSQSIPADGAVQFTAIATYGGGTTVDVTSTVIWSSASSSIATISSTGIASGISAGSTNITATVGAISGSSTLTVTTAELQKIVVTPANPNITPGQSQQLTATGTYSDGTTVEITSLVTWASSTPSIATINGTGLATGVTSGTSIFTASKGIVSGSTIPAITNEVELNDGTTTANPLTPTVTLTGQLLSNADVDYYTVTAGGPGAISVAFTGSATANNGWTVIIRDAANTVLASANIGSILSSSQTVNAGIAAAGIYYVVVQAPAGTTSIQNSTENYTLTISLSNRTNIVERELNNTIATANSLTPTVTLTGQLLSNADVDYYTVTAGGPGAISVAFTGSATAYNGWTVIIMDAANTVLASANIGSILSSSQTVSAGVATAGTYYVVVQAPAGTTSIQNSTENYTLTATVP